MPLQARALLLPLPICGRGREEGGLYASLAPSSSSPSSVSAPTSS